MAGSWHVGVDLTDGRLARADYRDPIVTAMRRINAAKGVGKPRPADADAQVAAWLDTHAAQSQACRDGSCGHTA